MIAVENLVKRFGRVTALDGISFEVKPGTVAGLVGGNGAGKSTTLRILATLMAPSSGDAVISGYDVVLDGIEVRRRIGFLSEKVPLYSNMRVGEFLRFRAGLKGIAYGRRKERVNQVVRQCALLGVERRIIGTLSRGYQKRVGLADALVHEPEVLILDEPTLGLDTTHAREIGNLIESLGGAHTVLFSTHSVEEAAAISHQVLVLERGRLVETDRRTATAVKGPAELCIMEVRGPREAILSKVRALPYIQGVNCVGDGPWHCLVLRVEQGRDVRSDLFALIAENRWILRELRLETAEATAAGSNMKTGGEQ